MIGGQLRRVALAGVVTVGLGIAGSIGPASGPFPTPVSAQEVPTVPSPPPGAGVVFESGLTSSDVFASGTCRTGQARGENVGEGFRLTVRGRCAESSNDADLAVPGRGITIGDGELALDFKAVSGGPRVRVSIYVRNKDRKLIGGHIKPGTGEIALFSTVEGNNTTLAYTNVGEILKPNDWNRAAIRVSGRDLWLLLNEEPVLHAPDVTDVPGGVGIWLFREGNPDDEDEVAVVFRGLTLSAVAEAEPARTPTYSAP